MFDLVPDVICDVKPVPEFKQKGSPVAYYLPPPLDRSNSTTLPLTTSFSHSHTLSPLSLDGYFYCNLKEVKFHPTWALRTLAYHEAIPGHHYQVRRDLLLHVIRSNLMKSLYLAYYSTETPWFAYIQVYIYFHQLYSIEYILI